MTQTEITREQYTKNAITISYDDLFRNNERYIGKTVYFKGKIIQVISYGNDYYLFRIAIFDAKYPNSVILVRYSGQRFLEDDVVEFWGTVNGIENYKTVLGQQVSAPSITAKYLEFPGSYQNIVTTSPTPTQTQTPIEVFSYTNLVYNYTLNYPTTWQIRTSDNEYGKNAYGEVIPIPDESAYPITRFLIEYRGVVNPRFSSDLLYPDLIREMESDPTISFRKSAGKIGTKFGSYVASGQTYYKVDIYGQHRGEGSKWVIVVHDQKFVITSEISSYNHQSSGSPGTYYKREMDIMIDTLKFY